MQLSETPSQSVNGDEPVTQIEDVPAQLQAEKERKALKIKSALERKNKATSQVLAEGSAPDCGPNTSSPVVKVPKDRGHVMKVAQSKAGSPRRSPRVAAASSPVVGRTRQSSRASPSVSKVGVSKQVKKPAIKVKKVMQSGATSDDFAGPVKKPAVKGNQGPKGKNPSKGETTAAATRSSNKGVSKAKKSVRFERGDDSQGDGFVDANEDEESQSGDDSDVSKVSLCSSWSFIFICFLHLVLLCHEFMLYTLLFCYCVLPYTSFILT